jgi:hypothetical protein
MRDVQRPPLQPPCRDQRQRLPIDVCLSDIELNFTYTRCGKKGAEVRPKFSQARWAA